MNDTKKAFDFTGELKKLNESGASDRRSFMEQLENAFKTPAKIDLGLLRVMDGLLGIAVPLNLCSACAGSSCFRKDGGESRIAEYSSQSHILDVDEPTFDDEYPLQRFDVHGHSYRASMMIDASEFEICSVERIIGMKEPTMLVGSNSLGNSEDLSRSTNLLSRSTNSHQLAKSQTLMNQPSNGQLNKAFKFGEKSGSQNGSPAQPSALSSAVDALQHHTNSNAAANNSAVTRHLRHSSGLSFAGFDSFEEVRRGFECHESRAPFYPPTARRTNHGQQESMFRIASISSFGHVTNPRVPDPLEYEMPSLPSSLQHGWEYQGYLLCLPVIQPLEILGYRSAVGY
ncbi:hypothetical protein C8J56DRAFT_1052721 [Mycena floridula]|nr:hypothetical protein C8J56DRAFT_1052721 [Mycena floridula]